MSDDIGFCGSCGGTDRLVKKSLPGGFLIHVCEWCSQKPRTTLQVHVETCKGWRMTEDGVVMNKPDCTCGAAE